MINQATKTSQDKIPTIAKSGCVCIKLNPTIWGPRVHVQTVFSHATRTAKQKANGDMNIQYVFNQFGNPLSPRFAGRTRFGMSNSVRRPNAEIPESHNDAVHGGGSS